MSPLDFVVLVLASSQIVHTWRTGSLFSGWRAAIEARSDAYYNDGWSKYWWAALLHCAYCFSHWTPLVILLICCSPASPEVLRPWLLIPVYGLAATRVGYILDGMLPPRLRYEPGVTRYPTSETLNGK